MTRTERLSPFVAAGAGVPFVFGRSCCALWVADWIAAERGMDPAADLRGTFRCHLGSLRLQRRSGGLADLVTGPMAAAGLERTDQPRAGDVGVVAISAGEIAGICLGDRWAMKTKEGIVIMPAAVVKAWSV